MPNKSFFDNNSREVIRSVCVFALALCMTIIVIHLALRSPSKPTEEEVARRKAVYAENAQKRAEEREVRRLEQEEQEEREREMAVAKMATKVADTQLFFERCTKDKPFFTFWIESYGGTKDLFLRKELCDDYHFKDLQAWQRQANILNVEHDCKSVKLKYTHTDDLIDSYGNVTRSVNIPVFQATWQWNDVMRYDCEMEPDVFVHANIQLLPSKHRYIAIKYLCSNPSGLLQEVYPETSGALCKRLINATYY